MNDKIALPRLSALLASKAGISSQKAETFIKAFFNEIAQALEQGKEVEIKGLGRFLKTGDFEPSKDFKEAVNAPFAMFTSEPLSPDISITDLDVPQPEPKGESEPVPESKEEWALEHEKEPEVTPEPEHEQDPEAAPEPEYVPASEPNPVPEPKKESAEDKSSENALVASPTQQTDAPKPSLMPSEDVMPYELGPNENESPKFVKGLIIGFVIGLAIGCAAAYFITEAISGPRQEAVVEEVPTPVTPASIEPHKADSVIVQETLPVEPKAPVAGHAVTDTVRPGYLMIEMAKKHYGNKHFWVYIYEENASKIKDRNVIPAGMVLTIPPAEKYGIDPNNPESVDLAKQKERKLF